MIVACNQVCLPELCVLHSVSCRLLFYMLVCCPNVEDSCLQTWLPGTCLCFHHLDYICCVLCDGYGAYAECYFLFLQYMECLSCMSYTMNMRLTFTLRFNYQN